MPLAALIVIVTRVNLPISVALVWITNPITHSPMFYASYRLGSWILGIVTLYGSGNHTDWLSSTFGLSVSLVVGAFVCGLISGSGFTATYFIWRNRVPVTLAQTPARTERAKKRNGRRVKGSRQTHESVQKSRVGLRRLACRAGSQADNSAIPELSTAIRSHLTQSAWAPSRSRTVQQVLATNRTEDIHDIVHINGQQCNP